VRKASKKEGSTVNNHWYFAYGSNLDMGQKECRTGIIREARRARLDGYRIAFNKRGSDETGKANIIPDASRVVWGVVYLCNPTALNEMDKHEGVRGGHYYRKNVRVECDSGELLEAVTYVAGEAFLQSSLARKPDYLQMIIHGARTHGLPQHYIHEIEGAARGEA
jgi:gamma-glutamylcyclotransferase (GGCT)/AIG2-like uncharacterized protein YtfP